MICNFKLGFEKRMMSGVKYTKFATVLLLSAGLSACAAERETVVRASAEADRPAVSTYRPIHKQLTETRVHQPCESESEPLQTCPSALP